MFRRDTRRQRYTIVLSKKTLCPYEHTRSRTNNSSATLFPPPPPRQPLLLTSLGASLMRWNWLFLPVGRTVPIVPSLDRHRRTSPSTRLAIIVILIVINIFFSSFNDVDPSHMMLVDCCVLCCRECGPIAAV